MSAHGTYQRYNTGCRCDDCRQAKNAYHRALRARKRALRDNRRFAWRPIGDALRARLGPAVKIGNFAGTGPVRWEGATDKAMGAALGVSGDQIRRWRERGWLTSTQADHAAVALGLHPALVWDGWYADETEGVA